MMKIEALPGRFGADVLGADFSRPLTADQVRQLADAIFEHRVLRFRDQRHLSREEYARLGAAMGDPIRFPHIDHRHDDFPELIRVGNAADTPLYQRDGAAFWHTDGTYDLVPVTITMLHALEAPDDGGETRFADLVAAYEALPQAIRDRLDGRKALHRMSGGKRFDYEKQVTEEGIAYGATMDDKRGRQVTAHPIVLRHPVTGRKSLYGIAGTSFGIEGMSPEDGEALLTELKRHATEERFRTEVKAHAGDILMWDCLSSIHSAVPIEYSDAPGRRRVLLRLSVTGLPEPYRHLPPPFVAEDAVPAAAVA